MLDRLRVSVIRIALIASLLCALPVWSVAGATVLDSEKREIAEQRQKLRNTYIIIAMLGGLLAFGLASCFRTRRLNRRLRASEALVFTQNEYLTRAGEELRQAKEQAEQASRIKTQFIQSMTHEVRTPLNSIVGFSQVLVSQFRGDPSAAEYVAIIESSSLNLQRLIEAVLDISWLDQTDAMPCPDLRELNSLCREITDLTLRQIKPGVALIFEPSDENPEVCTNVRRVMQVIGQVLQNAVKFTVHGEIILNYTCDRAMRRMRFTISDTGPGIPADKCEAIFDRFVKLNAFSPGTGLGLSVCRIIAERLGGRIYVDSSYTRGCRMIFEVPFGTPQAAE